MNLKIRPINDRDGDDLAALYAFESVIEQTGQLPHGNAEFWSGFYPSKGVRTVELVAECDGQAVGHLGILLNEHPRRKHVGTFGVAVHPDYQGKGVGSALIGELINLADNWLNLLKIELDVSTSNAVAVKLYEKFDFRIEGESRCDLFRKGRYSHSYKMARFNPNYELAALPIE